MPFFWEITLSGAIPDARHWALDAFAMPAPRAATAAPRPASLFEPVRDRYGLRLALVFGNHADGGLCPYIAAKKCFHCDIGFGEGAAFDLPTNRRRLAFFREYYEPHLASINHLVLYNSGSVLSPREMPPELLDEILAFARSLPALHLVSLDSREAYIRPPTIERVLQCLDDRHAVHPILGLESADDRIRNELLDKRMPHSAIVRVFRDLGALAAKIGKRRLGLDINIVIAGPGTTAETAVDDAVATARFALELGLEHGIKVDLNLHPYYSGQRGSAHFPEHPRCSLATAVRVISQTAESVRLMEVESALFVGLHDEGHDLNREERRRESGVMRNAIEWFNRTNDSCALNKSSSPHAPGASQSVPRCPREAHHECRREAHP